MSRPGIFSAHAAYISDKPLRIVVPFAAGGRTYTGGPAGKLTGTAVVLRLLGALEGGAYQ
ncbi:MAG: hypothetical protein Q8N51_18820 [Gammaproteobacteria bacterium]|nr:hypothetical protein [Gammaproteobacteria bacterium]